MTDLLTLGAAGLRAYTTAMGTIGDNIANAQTLGYVRRTTRIGETVPAGSGTVLTRTEASSGYRTIAIDREINQWLVDDSRSASADAGMASARLNWVEATESALAQSGNGITTALGNLFNHADALTADPASPALRNQFLGSVGQVAGAFQRTAVALAETGSTVASTANVAVNQLNTNLKALQQINIALLRASDGTANQSGLMDERDRLLDAITDDIPVSIEYGNRGQAVVRFDNATGPVLLDGGTLTQIGVTAAADGRLSYSLSPVGTAIAPSSGQLGGLSSAASHVADQRTALDTLAAQVANDLNSAHAAGTDANGNPGTALFVVSGGAASLTATSLATADVAAADATGPSGNLLAMAGLRNATGIEANWANQVAAQSQFVAAARAEDAAAGARRDAAYTARSVASAVDLDNEAAELLRFQQAYQASARVIQVARENIQAILNAF